MQNRGRPRLNERKNKMAWFYIFAAVLTEVSFVLAMKESHGFSKLLPTAFTIAVCMLNMYLLALSMRTLPAGVAYSILTGGGIVGVTLVGVLVYKDSVSVVKVIFFALIIVGMVGLRLTSEQSEKSPNSGTTQIADKQEH